MSISPWQILTGTMMCDLEAVLVPLERYRRSPVPGSIVDVLVLEADNYQLEKAQPASLSSTFRVGWGTGNCGRNVAII
jgi:hypothetical protein